MRLTLDVTPLLLRSAGVKNHLYYWTRALEEARGNHTVDYFPYLRSSPDLNHESGLEQGIPNWRLFLVAASNFGFTHPVVSRLLGKFDVFHGSPQTRLPPRARRLTSHIHDLTCWRTPEFHTRVNISASRQMAEHVWKKADRLIAVSESARADAIELIGLDPDRIEVIPHGVPEEYFTALPGCAGKPYVLTVGTIEPRKNIDRLLDSWLSLPQELREQFELRVAGPAGWKAEATLARLRSGLPGVRYLGYVAEARLPALTAGCTALAYPSLYEGFGFPIAQAMAAGVPVLTSNISSMPEVSAGAAVLVDPRSTNEITAGLQKLLTSPTLRKDLGARGKAYAQRHYRWPAIAAQSWRFFERAAS